ncbi:MAG: hypothetical protein WC650_00825 [Candidatus Doudnabacteria bacterium]
MPKITDFFIQKKKFIFVLFLLLIWYSLFLIRPIDLTTADLGRHLKNGELILQGDFQHLFENYYSYTYPDFPFTNHHWGSAVIFYLVLQLTGFAGLHLFYVVASFIIFTLFFILTKKEAGLGLASIISFLVLPLIAERGEVRPEIFTYLFVSLFFWLLWEYRKGRLPFKWLFLLPIIQILWVNTHIYFFLGPVLIAVFLLERLIFFSPQKIKKIGLILILVCLASLINPFFVKGAIYPFKIFQNYGYEILENKSVIFLEKYGLQNPNLLLFEIILGLLILSFVILLIFNRHKFSLPLFCLAAIFSFMGWWALRNFTLFGLFTLPILAINLKNILASRISSHSWSFKIAYVLTAIFILIFFLSDPKCQINYNVRLGLSQKNNAAAEFLQKEKIRGPIFNNYDIGSYLIFHLYPRERIFVDNRPEAYPASFFKEVYIPMQEKKEIWQAQERKYNFNAIIFAYHDLTPWTQKFLVERVEDPAWAPVFVDNYTLIFLKRDAQNQKVIEQFVLPRERFKIENNKK